VSPVRPRRPRFARHALTLGRYMDLTLGPRDDEELDVLVAVYHEDARRFGPRDWCSLRWPLDGSPAIDTRRLAYGPGDDPAGVGCPGC
jgi:hypothetical protein